MKKISKTKKLSVIAVLILLVFLFNVGWLKPLEKYINIVLNPLNSSLYSLGTNIKDTYYKQANKVNLSQELEQTKNELNRLIKENARLKKLEEENKILRDHLGFLSDEKHKSLLANVISRGDLALSGEQSTVLIIDKGLEDGLVPGLAVLNSEGIVIGKIDELKQSLAKVLLSNDSNCRLAASIQGDEHTNGIAEGDLGLTIKMEFIPQSKKIAPGDYVITSGLESLIPRGLVIGRVSEVNKENNELWQTATIETIADTDNLIIVAIIFPASKEQYEVIE